MERMEEKSCRTVEMEAKARGPTRGRGSRLAPPPPEGARRARRTEALDGEEDEEGAEARADGDEAEWRPRLGVAREEGASAGELRGGDCGDGGKEQRPEGGPEQHGAHGRACAEEEEEEEGEWGSRDEGVRQGGVREGRGPLGATPPIEKTDPWHVQSRAISCNLG